MEYHHTYDCLMIVSWLGLLKMQENENTVNRIDYIKCPNKGENINH